MIKLTILQMLTKGQTLNIYPENSAQKRRGVRVILRYHCEADNDVTYILFIDCN